MIEYDEHKLMRQLKIEMVDNLINGATIFYAFCIEDDEQLPFKIRKAFLENILNFLRYINDNNPSEYGQDLIINVLSTLHEYPRCGAKLEGLL